MRRVSPNRLQTTLNIVISWVLFGLEIIILMETVFKTGWVQFLGLGLFVVLMTTLIQIKIAQMLPPVQPVLALVSIR